MKTATISALRSRLREYLNLTEPVVVTQNGRAKAVLWPVEDSDDLDRLLLANNTELMKLLDEADRRISATGGIPHERFWKQVNEKAKSTANRSRSRLSAAKQPARSRRDS
jgi:prevent-host-death family protein